MVSRINPILEELSTQTRGNYLTRSSSPNATAKALQEAIEKSEIQTEKIQKKQYHYTELYPIPLLLALLFFLLLHTRGIKYLIVLFSLLGVEAQASILDGFYLNQAYRVYKAKEYKHSIQMLEKINSISRQSQFALANNYYKIQKYQKAIAIYNSIHSTSPKIKQKLYYNIANAYVMLENYDKAKYFYVKTLQLGEDSACLYNLNLIALMKTKDTENLGIVHPKSKNSNESKDTSPQSEDNTEKSRDEDQPSSGSGSGGESKKEKNNNKKKKRLIMDNTEKTQPLSSKVYELINKGYIHETRPW